MVAVLSNGTLRLRAPNGQRLTVPTWMTDPWACRTIIFRPSPVCSVAALHDLRRLLAVFAGEERQ